MSLSMRILTLSLCLAFSNTSKSQLEEVVEVPGATAVQLFHRSEIWFAADTNITIQLRDTLKNQLISKGQILIVNPSVKSRSGKASSLWVEYNAVVECQEGRCILKIRDISDNNGPIVLYDRCRYPEHIRSEYRTKKGWAKANDRYARVCEQLRSWIMIAQAT